MCTLIYMYGNEDGDGLKITLSSSSAEAVCIVEREMDSLLAEFGDEALLVYYYYYSIAKFKGTF